MIYDITQFSFQYEKTNKMEMIQIDKHIPK